MDRFTRHFTASIETGRKIREKSGTAAARACPYRSSAAFALTFGLPADVPSENGLKAIAGRAPYLERPAINSMKTRPVHHAASVSTPSRSCTFEITDMPDGRSRSGNALRYARMVPRIQTESAAIGVGRRSGLICRMDYRARTDATMTLFETGGSAAIRNVPAISPDLLPKSSYAKSSLIIHLSAAE